MNSAAEIVTGQVTPKLLSNFRDTRSKLIC